MKEIKVKMLSEGTYVHVKDVEDATHIVLELSTYQNIVRLVKEKALQAHGLTKKHTGYRIIDISPFDEPHSKTRMPDDKYSSFNILESAKINDPIAKLEFLEKRKATKKIFVPCYLIEIQTPYKATISINDLEQVMYGELFTDILPNLGFENDVWPEPNTHTEFNVIWKKEKEKYVQANTVYRILLNPNLQDDLWHLQVFATAIPTTVPDEIK